MTGPAIAMAATLAMVAAAAAAAPIDAAPLPPGTRRVAASADECAVWQRERSFAATVEAHDGAAFAAHLHPGAVFDAGAPGATRGAAAVTAGWADIVAGEAIALRWRPGIVQIGGDADIALSKGPYILQSERQGETIWRVGTYQTVWRRDAAGGVWRVLFDGSAGAPMPMAGRAEAEAWVIAQPMSDCAPR